MMKAQTHPVVPPLPRLLASLADWFEHRDHVCLVFDLLGPSLYDILCGDGFKPFALSEISFIARQLLRALSRM